MSLAEIQARTRELDLRMRALLPPAPVARAVAATPSSDTSFATALQGALAGTPVAATSGSTGRGDVGARAVALAESQAGTPYRWGGNAPGGFDCSGLVQWTYKQLGVDLPRVSTQQATVGAAVSPADARPGDLVFFEEGKVDHIGIYAGGGKWVVAPHTGDVVKVEPVDLSKATTIRRIVPAPAAAAAAAPVAAPAAGGAADASLSGLPAAGKPYAAQITAAARAAGIPPALLAAVAWSESGFNPRATSGAGAVGLMQLMPRTAAGLGVDPRDPAQALAGGARYLAQQLAAFGGRTDLALAAYNAGPGAVRKHGGVPPYPETQNYVKTVLARYSSLGGTP